jgi:predicted ATPase/class 3 adenylate cyclase
MRCELPTGTVTFLFTDVEASTRLLHELGAERYAEALAEHRRVIREACAAQAGVEVDTQGDAFFFAFPTAPAALSAARALTEALDSGPISVRVGIHTGTPLVTDEGYVGTDVHRAARIAAVGHGGQVLVSASTASLIERDGLRDLGEHRFKDLSAPERVYQLGDDEFPPLASLYRTNLPVPVTPFLGREPELAELVALLERNDIRLLTLTGPGGTGKTRLALQAVAEGAGRYPEGVFWVALAPLRDPGLVLEQATQALGTSDELASYVADKRMLLLFDNFEHVLAAAPTLGGLLAACPNLDIVVTSRELLQVEGEHAYPVPTLNPDDAASLFLARSHAVAPGTTGDRRVGELCERLDNLPLAVELAAARTRHLTIDQLIERLSQRLDLLRGGRDVDPRQATLRATIEWSYELLQANERRLFATLSVFAGGCTLEAIEDICSAGLDEIGSLVDKSLLRRSEERYWMLETIRELAAERLAETGTAEDTRRGHAEHYLRFADGLGLSMESIESGNAQQHRPALAELANFRVALAWARDADPLLGLRLATALENLWLTQNPREGLRWFDELTGSVRELPTELAALVARCRGSTLVMAGRRDDGVNDYQMSLDLYRAQGDQRGVAGMLYRIGVNTDESTRARELLDGSVALAERTGFRTLAAQAGGALAALDYLDGEVDRGLEGLGQSAAAARDIGSVWLEANMTSALAMYTFELGRMSDAERYAREWVDVARRMGDRRHAVQAFAYLAVLAARRGDARSAGVLWGAIEAEEGRGPLDVRPRMQRWDEERKRFAEIVLAGPSPEFDEGRARGRELSLADAMEYARAES